MTLKEIRAVVDYHNKQKEYESKHSAVLSAFAAYNCALLVRAKTIPSSLQKAFPGLFNRTEDGQVLVEDWRQSKAAMDRMVEQYNRKFEKKGGT